MPSQFAPPAASPRTGGSAARGARTVRPAKGRAGRALAMLLALGCAMTAEGGAPAIAQASSKAYALLSENGTCWRGIDASFDADPANSDNGVKTGVEWLNAIYKQLRGGDVSFAFVLRKAAAGDPDQILWDLGSGFRVLLRRVPCPGDEVGSRGGPNGRGQENGLLSDAGSRGGHGEPSSGK